MSLSLPQGFPAGSTGATPLQCHEPMDRPAAHILITRPQEAAQRFANDLQMALPFALSMVQSPIMEIESTPEPLPLDGVRGIIVTSQNGVAQLAGRTQDRSLPLYCVGARTTALAKDAGFSAEQLGTDAESLVSGLQRLSPPAPLLHLHGAVTRGDVAGQLTAAGLPTRSHILYRQTAKTLSPEAKNLLEGTEPVVLPLFSPRSAELLAQQISGTGPRYVVAMSKAVAAEIPQGWAKTVIIAQGLDSASMVQAVTRLFDDDGFIVSPDIRG